MQCSVVLNQSTTSFHFFFSSRRRHTRYIGDWSSDVCSSDLAMADAGASVLTFHPEATIHVQRHLDTVKKRDMLAGLALNPASPLALVEDVLDAVDLLLIMTVNPGYGGQSYLPAATAKIRRARGLPPA